jgi:putative membrane protein
MWGAHEGMGWWMLLGTLWFVVFWGVILYVIVSGVSRFGRRRDDDDALEILKRRYARGELSAEEFEHMRQELT